MRCRHRPDGSRHFGLRPSDVCPAYHRAAALRRGEAGGGGPVLGLTPQATEGRRSATQNRDVRRLPPELQRPTPDPRPPTPKSDLRPLTSDFRPLTGRLIASERVR